MTDRRRGTLFVLSAATIALAFAVFLPLACVDKETTGAAQSPSAPPSTSTSTATGAGALGTDWAAAVKRVAKEWHGSAKLAKPPVIKKTGALTQVSYQLDLFPVLIVYPNPQLLPGQYQPYYPDMLQTIQLFTGQSLKNDGYADATVQATFDGMYVDMQITASDPGIQNYPNMHSAFVFWAAQSLIGDGACYACTTCSSCGLCGPGADAAGQCWDQGATHDDADANQPWAPFLPLGLPLVNQVAVTFLDYPPAASLTKKDYLNNFTMHRWSDVLRSEGIANPTSYETIVDSRPIAAAGSGQTALLPQAIPTFNNPTTGGAYLGPMLSLLATPPSTTTRPNTLPLVVLGQPAKDAWGQMIHQTVNYLDVGTSNLPLAGTPTNWIASRHPDDTTYQCCPGDNTKGCCVPGYECGMLVPYETGDLITACVAKTFVTQPSTTPQAAKSACQASVAADPRTLCIRARLDYDYVSPGQCKCLAAAQKFCDTNKNNACPTGVQGSCDNSMCP